MVETSLCHIQKVAPSVFVDYVDASNPKAYLGKDIVDNVGLQHVTTDPLTGWILFDETGRPNMEPGFEDQATWATIPCFETHENSLISVWLSSDATGWVQFEGETTGITFGPFTVWPSPSVTHEIAHEETLLKVGSVAEGPTVTLSSLTSAVDDIPKASPGLTGTTILPSPHEISPSVVSASDLSTSNPVSSVALPTITSYAAIFELPGGFSIFADIPSSSSSTILFELPSITTPTPTAASEYSLDGFVFDPASTVLSGLPSTTSVTPTQTPDYFLSLFVFAPISSLFSDSPSITTADLTQAAEYSLNPFAFDPTLTIASATSNSVITTGPLAKTSEPAALQPTENSYSLSGFEISPGPMSSASTTAFPPSSSLALSTGIPESSTVSYTESSNTEDISDIVTSSTESTTSSGMIEDATSETKVLALKFTSGVSMLATSSSISISLTSSMNPSTSNVATSSSLNISLTNSLTSNVASTTIAASIITSLTPSTTSTATALPSSSELPKSHNGLIGGTKWDPITGEPVGSKIGYCPAFNPPVDYDPMSALKGNTQWNPVTGQPIKKLLDGYNNADKFTKLPFNTLPEPRLSSYPDVGGKLDLLCLNPVEPASVPEHPEDQAGVSENSPDKESDESSGQAPPADTRTGRTALSPLTPVVAITGVTLVDPFTGKPIIVGSGPNHRLHVLRNTVAPVKARVNTMCGSERASIAPRRTITRTDVVTSVFRNEGEA